MKRLIATGLLLVLVAASAWQSAAASPFGKYLPPDQAFQLNAEPQSGAVLLNWQIADGYYLYRDRFKFKADSGTIGAADFPAGEIEQDPNFGKVEIYRHALQVRLPITQVPTDRKLTLTVTYQGCADAGLCYSPITKQLTLILPQATAGGALTNGGSGSGGPGAGVGNEQTRLADLVAHANPAWFALVFFGLGLLLAFTPCVLPMVPILAGILGGERDLGTRRGFALSLTYVLAMAAVYTGAGVAAGFAGTGLQAFFQAPWVIALFVAIFVALALSLFGLYTLRLPARVSNRLGAVSGRGGFAGAIVMGIVAALVVSPCVAAPLAGALVAIGHMGTPLRGGVALAALALGMGAPLVVYGTLAGRLLPKAGHWMILVERLLGVVLLAYAVWLLGRIVPAPVTLVLWGVTGLIAAAWILVFAGRNRGSAVWQRLSLRGGGALVGAAALILIVGGALGGSNPLAPFAGLRPATRVAPLTWQPVASVAQLRSQLALAAMDGRPVLVDFYADWCTSCVEMEHSTFRDPTVRAALGGFKLLRADVTANTAADRQLLEHFGLYGPPAYLFFDRAGRPLTAASVVGFMSTTPFLARLRQALGDPGTSDS